MIRRVVIGLIVLQRPPKIRFHMHVGFRIKLAHHFAHEATAVPVNAPLHVRCNPPAFAHLAVQPHDLGLGEARYAVPVFRNARRVHAVHLFPLPLRVVFYERRLLRAVQHLEDTLQRHDELHQRPHDEVHRFDSALGVLQLRRILPLGVHFIEQANRRGVLHERVINERARLVQQFLPALGQLLARHDALFVQVRVIQLGYQLRCRIGAQHVLRAAHVNDIFVDGAVL
ncbi:MAG: hypothetical protein EBU84_00880 [Actinobacteria bacterium]|nr:hypothetical protein [Actinomycetota bacterium]